MKGYIDSKGFKLSRLKTKYMEYEFGKNRNVENIMVRLKIKLFLDKTSLDISEEMGDYLECYSTN